jgi:glutamyl-tRNA synthetase
MIEKETIEAYALENALSHGGKANPGAVIKSLFTEGLKKENIKDIVPQVNEIIEKINSLPQDKQTEKFNSSKSKIKKRERREGLPDLPNAEKGNVVMRIAPFPSGPLHIGNTRQLILNDEYAKMYDGKLILVLDDTIGSEAKPIEPEAYRLIEEGVSWIGAKVDKKIIRKSDRLQKYYDYAEELIKKGYMYVCSCTQEEMRNLRVKGIECGCRRLPGTEQLQRWKGMFKPEAKQGDFTVRLKTSMQAPDPAFRDRVMFRISEREHPLVKNKYKVWPLLEFAFAIDDHLLGVTHIIRGIDLVMETKVEKFIWDIFKWEHPETIHTGFLAIQGIKLSKSKGSREVRSGEYIGWDDPRTWSLQSLKTRGIQPEAIREFILNLGLTKANSTIAIDVLYALNKKFLEKVHRYFFVPNPTKIHVKGSPEFESSLPLHPTENIGNRKYNTKQHFYVPKKDLDLSEEGNFRLMHLLNFKADKLSFGKKDFHFLSSDPDQKLNVKFVQWLPADDKNEKDLIKTTIRMPDSSTITGLAEANITKLKKDEVIQFERFGFVKLKKLDKKTRTAEFWFAHS